MKEWAANNPRLMNNVQKAAGAGRGFLTNVAIAIVIIGVCYIILAPVIGIVSRAFMTLDDVGNPLVFLLPLEGTLYNLQSAMHFMNYWRTLGVTLGFAGGLALLHVIVCSLVGYGFARFNFPGRDILFGLAILTIVIPTQAYMIPMFLNFRFFLGQGDMNLLGTPWPIILLTVTGVGIRSGLYIYILRQFFRGIPKELEEAAFIDGAGPVKTFVRIMLPNAVPALITVFLFAFVWHFNDTYYSSMLMPGHQMMSTMVVSVGSNYGAGLEFPNPALQQMVTFGGVLLAIAPILLIYLFLQRFFVEGLERSGIVG
jgi:multiple sugar transport system permease protein